MLLDVLPLGTFIFSGGLGLLALSAMVSWARERELATAKREEPKAPEQDAEGETSEDEATAEARRRAARVGT